VDAQIQHGDCRELLRALPDRCVDSICNDIPYELGFMARAWDSSGIAFDVAMWAEVLRVAKPGAHMLVFGGTRTAHRIACAIEDAGWQCRDCIDWVYGSGFPKSLNLPGGLGTALKPAHEPIYLFRAPLEKGLTVAQNFAKWGTGVLNVDACRVGRQAADASGRAESGSAASPNLSMAGANYARDAKPDNAAGRWPPNLALTHDAACVRVGSRAVKANPTWDTPNRAPPTIFGSAVAEVSATHPTDGQAEDVPAWQCVEGCPVLAMDRQSGDTQTGSRFVSLAVSAGHQGHVFGKESRAAGTPKPHHSDAGTASRYFPQSEWSELDDLEPFVYAAKASRGERDRGLDHFRARSGGEATARADDSAGTNSPRAGAGRKGGARNSHPTVKPIEVLRYCCRLITPKAGGLVLDHTCGVGSSGVAATLEGFRFLGFELNDTDAEPYVTIARARLAHVSGASYVPRQALQSDAPPRQLALFEVAE
jgi:DNA modification methylase